MKQLSKQAGYTATAMVIMLAVAGIVTAGSARLTLRTAAANQGAALGTILGEVNKAVGTYTTYNYKALVDGTAVAGVATPLAPSIQELQALGLLNANFSATPPMGGGYAIQITREPTGCVAPNCNLTTRAWYTQPILDVGTGRVDLSKLGAAAEVMGGDGGWSDTINPSTVRGTGGWDRPNPVGNQAGILMAINGYGSSVFSQYVDRAGAQGMLGSLKMGGNNIVGAGAVTAGSVQLPSGNSLLIGNSAFYGDGANSAIRQAGSTYFQHMDGSTADIAQVGNVQSNGTVNSAAVATTGSINAGGNVQANGNVNSGGSMNVAGNMVASQVYSNGETSTNGWFRTNGDSGWYSQKWNGGIYMSDGQWVRSYGDKSMYTGGQMQAGSLQSNSSLTVAGNASVAGSSVVGSQTVVGSASVGGMLVVGGDQTVVGSASVSKGITPGVIASDGANCAGNSGAIARDSNNNLFFCN